MRLQMQPMLLKLFGKLELLCEMKPGKASSNTSTAVDTKSLRSNKLSQLLLIREPQQHSGTCMLLTVLLSAFTQGLQSDVIVL